MRLFILVHFTIRNGEEWFTVLNTAVRSSKFIIKVQQWLMQQLLKFPRVIYALYFDINI